MSNAISVVERQLNNSVQGYTILEKMMTTSPKCDVVFGANIKIINKSLVSAKLYSVPKKDDKIIFDLIVLYSKLFFNLITPWHEPVNLLWMLNDINLRHYLQYILYVVKGIKPISFSCLNQAVY